MWFCNIKGLEQHSRSRLPITIPKVSRSSLKNSNLLVSLCFQALYLRMLAWREGVEQYEVHGSQPGWGFACAELLRVLHLVPATDASPGFRVGAYSWRIGAGFWHASFTQGDNKCTGRHFTALISQRRIYPDITEPLYKTLTGNLQRNALRTIKIPLVFGYRAT